MHFSSISKCLFEAPVHAHAVGCPFCGVRTPQALRALRAGCTYTPKWKANRVCASETSNSICPGLEMHILEEI